MAASDSEDALIATDLFQEPADFYEAPKQPTKTTHTLQSGRIIEVGLVGHNPLWGHHLWNAGRIIATFLERNAETFVRGKAVLELGAGAGLPGLVCGIEGAETVVITDYPDEDLIENIRRNITGCKLDEGRVHAKGLLWGADTSEVCSALSRPSEGFDLLILADLLFNHSEHGRLVQTVQDTLGKRPETHALVFFTPYRPWLLEKDMAFFDCAKQAGFKVVKVLETVMDRAMFDNDPGDEMLRRTVYGYDLRWAS